MLRFEQSSLLRTTKEEVWKHAGSMAGVNRELFPVARMTVPARFKNMRLGDATPGQTLFRSWILFLGILPIDYDDITITAVFPSGGFQERSRMATNRVWSHKRTIIQEGSFCRITDEVEYEPNFFLLGWFMFPIYRLTFLIRHLNLRRLFGEAQ